MPHPVQTRKEDEQRTVWPGVSAGSFVAVCPLASELALTSRASTDSVSMCLAIQPSAAVHATVLEHELAPRSTAVSITDSWRAARKRQRRLKHLATNCKTQRNQLIYMKSIIKVITEVYRDN